MIISFWATGESHISSLIFKRGILRKNGTIHFEPSGEYPTEGLLTQHERESKKEFQYALKE